MKLSLIQKVLHIYKRVFRSGINPDLSLQESQQVYLSNVFAFFTTLFTLGFLPFYFIFEIKTTFMVAVATVIILPISIFLNSKKLHQWAKFSMLLIICLLLGTQGLEIGKEAHIQMLYIPLVIGMVAIVDTKEKFIFSLAISIPIFCIILLVFLQSNEFELIPLKTEHAEFFYYLNLTTTILGSIIVIGFFGQNFRRQTMLLEKRTEELEQSKKSMIQTFQIARIGFSEVDLQKKTLNWGPGIKKILGLSLEYKPTFERYYGMVHPEDRSHIREAIRRTLEKGESFEQTYRMIRQTDQQIITIQSYGRVILNASGEPVKMHAVIRDITEEKKQKDLIHKEKERAEAADMAKSLFLSNISHEIRTPLHGLLGFARLLDATSLSPEQRKYVSMMTYSGETLMALLNDILDISGIEQGKIEFKKEAFLLEKLVQNCLAPYKNQAQEKGLSLHIQHGFDHSEAIFSDSLRIKQILVNLVSNAIKYTSQGEVTVEISLLKKDEWTQMSLQIIVRDTGIGVPKELQESIFHTFSQVNGTTSDTRTGLGLGLAIVKRLLTIAGGEINLISPWTQDPQFPGSSFQVSIPVEQASLSPTLRADKISELKTAQPLKILVAEDNEVNQVLITTILTKANFDVLLASDGKEAIDLSRSTQVDLVLMDVHMPVMDGYCAAREIRKEKPDLPIIALSANAFKEDIQKSIQSGMNAHLSKPLRLEDLSAAIGTFLSERVKKYMQEN